MYNMSMLRHRFSTERLGGGGGGALNHLPLLFCKSVYTGRQQQKNHVVCRNTAHVVKVKVHVLQVLNV